MPTHDKPTGDNAHSSQPDAQQKSGSGIKAKVSGAGNVIHGTTEVIRGLALDIGEFGHGHGKGKAIMAAGREKVERGLDKIDGKPTATSAADHASHQGGVGDGIGSAPNLDSNTAHASTAAPSAEKAREDVADARHPAGRGTASAAANDTHGRMPEPHHYEQTAATALPRDRPTTADDPGVQRDTDVRQQGNMIASNDRGETRTTAAANSHGRTPEQHHYEQTPVAALPRDRPTTGDGPGVQRDTDVHQQGNWTASGDRGKETTTAVNGSYGRTQEQHHYGQTPATALSCDRPTTRDDPGVQPDTDVRQQGNMTASSDRNKDTHTTAAATGGQGRTPEQHHYEQTHRPTTVDDPGVQRDTDVRQQGNTIASNDRDREARTTAKPSYPANAVGQEQPFGTVL